MSTPEQDDIFILDLPARVVGGFQSARGVGEGWVAVSLETEHFQSTGLAAGFESGAPELVLDLNLEGFHVLHLALGSQTALNVWLGGESGAREFITQHGTNRIQECRFHRADLTGKKLHIAPKTGPAGAPAWLCYIRAEPADAPIPSARNLVATNDGSTWYALNGMESPDDLKRYFTPFRDSDFGLMLYGMSGADYTISRSHDASRSTPDGDVSHIFRRSSLVRVQAENVLCESGQDLLKIAVESAHEVGMKIHFYIRVELWQAPFPGPGFSISKFFEDNPQWRCRDEDGDEILRMSYAFPEVQNHILEFYRALLECSPDGLCLAFNRSLPMMICEEPVLEEFERVENRRPRLPEEADSEAMIAARTRLMNGFLERVRTLTDEHQKELSCIATPDDEFNRVAGLDLMSLCENKIFDAVMVHSGGHHAAVVAAHQMPFWNALKTRVPLYLYGWGGDYNHAASARFLKENIFEAGFAGGFFWDTELFFENPYNWHVIRQGGAPGFLAGVLQGQIASPVMAQMTRVNGVKLGRHNPGRSY